ncbi:MAG TPA: hypothetical protein VGF48_23840 [Thermoanaerobaculia bacterium]|jgi:biotin carboxylase
MHTILVIGGTHHLELRAAIERRGHAIFDLAANDAPLALVERIATLHAQQKFVAIVAACEEGRVAAAMASAKLGLRGVSLGAVLNTGDRARMRSILHHAGMGQVLFRKCTTRGEAAEFLMNIGGAIVLYGQEEAAVVRSSSELHAAWERISRRAVGGVLCEEHVDGSVVSVEGCSISGRFHGAAVTSHAIDRQGVTVGYEQPARVSDDLRKSLFAFTSRVIALLGVTDGVTHTTWKLTARGPVLIGTTTRNGGGRIPLLTQLSSGIDLADAEVAHAVGEGIAVPQRIDGEAVAVRLIPATDGIVSYVDLPDASEVYAAGTSVTAGDLIHTNHEPLAWVVTTGERAVQRADAFAARIEIIIEEERTPCAQTAS